MIKYNKIELSKNKKLKGILNVKIVFENNDIDFINPNATNLVDKVSVMEKEIYGNGLLKIVLVDLGVKNNIIRCLLKRDVTLIKVPWKAKFILTCTLDKPTEEIKRIVEGAGKYVGIGSNSINGYGRFIVTNFNKV